MQKKSYKLTETNPLTTELKKKWVKTEIKKEIKNFLELNEN